MTSVELPQAELPALPRAGRRGPRGLTIIAFSGDMDKLLAAFMLATGAAAMDMRVSMFFTFWGLLALKRRTGFRGKGLIEKLMTAMLPSGPDGLGLSKMNMLGLGRLFLGLVMRRRHVETLPNLIAVAQQQGIRLVACQLSMEMLGLRRDELVDGVEFGGVASCLDAVADSGSTVFI